MGNDYRCPVGLQLIQGSAHALLTDGVQMRSGLIQNQHRSILQERPGDGDPLALSSRKAGPPLANRRF